MDINCTKCKRTVTVDPGTQHGRVVVNHIPSVLQCTCGKHIFPGSK